MDLLNIDSPLISSRHDTIISYSPPVFKFHRIAFPSLEEAVAFQFDEAELVSLLLQ
jgi:hypothetical protein